MSATIWNEEMNEKLCNVLNEADDKSLTYNDLTAKLSAKVSKTVIALMAIGRGDAADFLKKITLHKMGKTLPLFSSKKSMSIPAHIFDGYSGFKIGDRFKVEVSGTETNRKIILTFDHHDDQYVKRSQEKKKEIIMEI